jgi:hypothetical protein
MALVAPPNERSCPVMSGFLGSWECIHDTGWPLLSHLGTWGWTIQRELLSRKLSGPCARSPRRRTKHRLGHPLIEEAYRWPDTRSGSLHEAVMVL